MKNSPLLSYFSFLTSRLGLRLPLAIMILVISLSGCRRSGEQSPGAGPSAVDSAANSGTPLGADDILAEDDTLLGQSSMSVAVTVSGMRDIPDSVFRQDIEGYLGAAGITVLPPEAHSKNPTLLLRVDVSTVNLVARAPLVIVYVMSLNYRRLVPGNSLGAKAKYVRVTLWDDGTFGACAATEAQSLRIYSNKLTKNFIEAYKRVNSKK